MYPVYRDMNSHYPYQTPPAPFNFSTWEAFRPQMKEDGANTRPMPEYWASNYGYPTPMPCQNCCTHGQQPSYNFRPPSPHFPMSPSYGHYYGGYPATYPQPYPYPYVPPPHYSMEMPRYDFDKGSLKAFHCCECPNHHPSHVKSTSNVKIEEQEPDAETQKVAPLIPVGLSSSPHPLMWAPPMNTEQPRRVFEGGNSDELQVLPNLEKPKKSDKPAEKEPNVRYQWLPLDMNSIKRLMEGGELIKSQEKNDGDEKKASDVEKKDQNRQFSYPVIWMPYGGQGEDQTRGKEEKNIQEKKDGVWKKSSDVEKKEQNRQFPYPIIWMPYGGQGEDQTCGQEEKNISKSPAVEVEDRNKAKLPVEEHPTLKLLKHPDKGLLKERIESGDDANGAGCRESRKTGNVKIIPVKQLDNPVPKSEKKEQEGELNNSVKNVEPVKNGNDMKPSSPTKKSKLPPICLRVDPPRKKNGKGSSRSPSPPGEQRHQASSGVKEEGKENEKIQVMEVAGNVPKRNSVTVPDVSKEEKGSGTCVEVAGNAPKGNSVTEPDVTITKEEKGSGTREHESEAEEKPVLSSGSSKLNATVCEDNAVHALESQGVKESEQKDSYAPERKVLSETEAAVILQSAYRGYAVRRWEPLRKLKCIANVKDEARKVSERVVKLESCDTVDDKEKVAVGEMIMNLLLKLDTIQGLHSSVRDVRKSVAKELIRLQEKLDSIGSQVSIPASPHSSTITGVEQEDDASGSDERLAETFEIMSEGPRASELGEKEGEEASVSEVPLSQSLDSQVTNKEELGRESHNEEIVPPNGSEYEVLESCLEKKDMDPEESITLSDQKPLKEGNQDAEVPQENVENDILRMEWECDLGTVKIDQEETEVAEPPRESEEQLIDISCPVEKCDEDVASALEAEKVAEECGEVIVENDIEIEASENSYNEPEVDQLASEGMPALEVEKHVIGDGQVIESVDSEDTLAHCADTGTCYNDQDENLDEPHQLSLDEVGDDICRMEWECDIGAAKFTAGIDQEEIQVGKLSQEHELQASEVENSETEDQADQLSGKSEVQSDDFNAVDTDDTENHTTAELCDEKNTDTRESDTGVGILNMDAQASAIPDDSMEVPIVEQGQAMPSLEPVMEVEKQTIAELPVSEGVSLTEAQEYDEQINDETNRRIIEENEKLRSMVEQLLASGKDQQNVISTLTAKVNALEKKLPKRRNKLRSGKRPRVVLTRNGS